MNPLKFKIKNMRFVFLLVILLLFAGTSHAQAFQQAICTGNGQVTGIIPTSILNGQSSGEQSVLNISILIMLVILVVVAAIYMISYIMGLEMLKNMVKSEIIEVIITAIIVFVFIGSFNLAAAGISSTNVFHAAGTSFGKSIFVDDCSYLVNSSIGLIAPIFQLNIVRYFLNSVSSLTITVQPSNFGFSDTPFLGFGLFDNLLNELEDIAGAFIILNTVTALMIGIIFGLFPVFLYVGIVLRTLPWTRAAGGAFLGLFVGFYIAFPLLLHIMLGGYIQATGNGINFLTGATPANLTATADKSAGFGVPSFLSYGLNFIYSSVVNVNLNGLVNGFINSVIEPALYTFISLIVTFIISFDIAETAGDLLGAPSLTSEKLFNKLI